MLKSGKSKNKKKRYFEAGIGCPMCDSAETTFETFIKDFRFLFCSNCEITFCPEITPKYLSILYSTGFHGPEDGGPKRGWRKDLSFLKPAFKLLPQKEKLCILEFGAGQDAVSEVLRENGHRAVAVDIAPPLRPHPDRLTRDLIDLSMEPNQFDLVFSFQVFEHLPQPKPILDELFRLSKPEGLILIHTDMETPERESEGFENWWYVMPPDHCTFFRHKIFKIYLKDRRYQMLWKDPKTVILKKSI